MFHFNLTILGMKIAAYLGPSILQLLQWHVGQNSVMRMPCCKIHTEEYSIPKKICLILHPLEFAIL